VLNGLAHLGQPVDLHFLWRPQLNDPLDEMVLETALNGRADALVTPNLRDFVPAARFGLPVIPPAECLKRLRRLQRRNMAPAAPQRLDATRLDERFQTHFGSISLQTYHDVVNLQG